MSEETFLFIDTETTGFKKNGALVQQGQARVCQIAMLLTDAEGNSLSEFSSLVKPDGWKISEGAGAVHGFTDDICEKYGLDFGSVVRFWRRTAALSTLVIAHNEEFDKGMMQIEEAYFNQKNEGETTFMDRKWFCTMKSNTKINPQGKWPKLNATLQHYTGRTLGDDAHDAMYDVKACRDIFFAMRKKEVA